ncbi:hypothetical protein K9O30_03760 [Clostridium bowmanii]|uniref:hypothetical protein n=1 Tax=Clostridium bowmanii TaxID=132925 RepID=UPI001C0AA6A4|nr:hypothetical protein [Clostridium bowmanii]MBU3188474.1 hypothetical protein [Clostridium bowmanii]MCA1072859.1 hypothetical protein [Clostridium bowmanii]
MKKRSIITTTILGILIVTSIYFNSLNTNKIKFAELKTESLKIEFQSLKAENQTLKETNEKLTETNTKVSLKVNNLKNVTN